MLASRLLSILMLLQTRGGMSASALAEELEVTVRTIHRDIDQLSAAGVPVYAERGRNGGFRLRDGYRTMLTGLDEAEAESLFLTGMPGPAAELGLADAMFTARLKLLAALPADKKQGAERIAERFHLDANAWFHGSDPLPSLPIVARAVWSDRVLRLRYRRSGEFAAEPRRLEPLGLVLKGGIWYLVARSGSWIRTYRAQNIRDAEMTQERFERPAGFDLAAHWQRAVREYESGVYREEADIRLTPRGVDILELLGPHVVNAARATAGKPDRHGRVRCRIPLESIEFGVRELLRLGDEVDVIGPPALRRELARVAAGVVRRHRRRARRKA